MGPTSYVELRRICAQLWIKISSALGLTTFVESEPIRIFKGRKKEKAFYIDI